LCVVHAAPAIAAKAGHLENVVNVDQRNLTTASVIPKKEVGKHQLKTVLTN